MFCFKGYKKVLCLIIVLFSMVWIYKYARVVCAFVKTIFENSLSFTLLEIQNTKLSINKKFRRSHPCNYILMWNVRILHFHRDARLGTRHVVAYHRTPIFSSCCFICNDALHRWYPFYKSCTTTRREGRNQKRLSKDAILGFITTPRNL